MQPLPHPPNSEAHWSCCSFAFPRFAAGPPHTYHEPWLPTTQKLSKAERRIVAMLHGRRQKKGEGARRSFFLTPLPRGFGRRSSSCQLGEKSRPPVSLMAGLGDADAHAYDFFAVGRGKVELWKEAEGYSKGRLDRTTISVPENNSRSLLILRRCVESLHGEASRSK
nr:hypothetical protein CFP56_34860 [Quercus suber]